jgi:hypothetical protein
MKLEPGPPVKRHGDQRGIGTDERRGHALAPAASPVRDLHSGELHEGTPAWRSVVALIESLHRERG